MSFSKSAKTIVSLDQWLALTPPELANAHLHADSQLMQALRKEKVPVV
jgi:oxalate decarboxylase